MHLKESLPYRIPPSPTPSNNPTAFECGRSFVSIYGVASKSQILPPEVQLTTILGFK
jgi:hypothetical protein